MDPFPQLKKDCKSQSCPPFLKAMQPLTEPQNTLSWKGSMRIIESSSWHCTAPPLNVIPLCLRASSKCFFNSQAWCCDYF